MDLSQLPFFEACDIFKVPTESGHSVAWRIFHRPSGLWVDIPQILFDARAWRRVREYVEELQERIRRVPSADEEAAPWLWVERVL